MSETYANETDASGLPLARVTMVHALRYGEDLLIYVEGLTSGFGGQIIVERSPLRLFPPLFIARENPGNPGINPNAPPHEEQTRNAYSFPTQGGSEVVSLEDAGGRREVSVVKVLPGETASGPEPPPDDGGFGECDWTAVLDLEPPGPGRLRVNGTCVLPTPHYRLTLRRAVPQGINPRILILNLEVEPPTMIVPQVLTPTSVSYEEAAAQGQFDQVQIQSQSELVKSTVIDVQEVH